MKADVSARHDLQVPRYTSYPTAPHFDRTVDAIGRRHGAAPGGFAAEMERLAPLIDDGICTVEESRVTVTEKGRPFVRLVAAAFDAYLTVGEQRHSRAV